MQLRKKGGKVKTAPITTFALEFILLSRILSYAKAETGQIWLGREI